MSWNVNVIVNLFVDHFRLLTVLVQLQMPKTYADQMCVCQAHTPIDSQEEGAKVPPWDRFCFCNNKIN